MSPRRGVVVLARSVLRYRSFDLSGLQAADRISALQVQLSAWQPYPRAMCLVTWQGDWAQVFAADEDLLDAQLGVENKASLWPETLLHEPGPDGVRLIQSLEGVEAQAWRGGVLLASRWWGAQPDAVEWLTFVRSAGLTLSVAAQAVPGPLALSWCAPSPVPIRADRMRGAGLDQVRLLLLACALILVAAAGFSAHKLWDAYRMREQMTLQLGEVRQQVAPLLEARDRALAANERSGAFLKPLRAPLPLDVMEHLISVLPKDCVLKEFDLAGLDLRLALELPPGASRSQVVADLEAGGWLVNVAEVKDGAQRAWVAYQMKLASPKAPLRSIKESGLKASADRDSLNGVNPDAGAAGSGSRKQPQLR